MNKNNDNNTNDIDSNIASAKIDLKLAVNKSLYLKDMITEEMYIKANEIIIKSAPPRQILAKNKRDSFER